MHTVEAEERRVSEWLAAADLPAVELRPLAGDVSARRYYRAQSRSTQRSWIVAVYPPELRSRLTVFAQTTRLLERSSVRVPALYRMDSNAGLALLEDVGDANLYTRDIARRELFALYRRAATIGGAIAEIAAARVEDLNPPLDRELFEQEIEQTWELFLDEDLSFDRGLATALRQVLETICAELDTSPRVPCHRDFMARNIHLSGAGELIVLDHQDLRLGPAEYDLASLLHDSCRLEQDDRHRLQETHSVDPLCFSRCVVQRMLKIVGTFHAFAQRGSDRHLAMVPAALETAARHLQRLPEGRELAPRLLERWGRR